MALFDRLAVKHIIHCGDVGGIAVFDELVDRRLSFVWGNTDFPDNGVFAYLDSVGLSPPETIPLRVTLDNKTFAVFHGHERGFDDALHNLDVDFILHGHTHLARDETFNSKRIINPGALHRAHTKTVATLETSTGQLTFHEINA
jgi:putative phosphoesterase